MPSFSGNGKCERGEYPSCSLDCGPFELTPKFSWPPSYDSTDIMFDVKAVNNVTLSGISFWISNEDSGK
jgi:hypothetical protein